MQVSNTTTRTSDYAPPIVRLRCLHCDVAWTGEADSDCWVCELPGTTLNAAFVRRDRSAEALEEFDLLR